MRRKMTDNKQWNGRRITAAAVAGLSAAAVVITSVLSGAIEAEAADTLLGIEKLRSRYKQSGSEFVILEVVPDRKAARIGYLVGGYEPILSEWDEEEQVWKSWRNTLCDLPKTKRGDFVEGKKEELREYYRENGLTGHFPVEAVEAVYEEGEPGQKGFEKIVSDGSKKTGWFQKVDGTREEGTDRYQVAFHYSGLYNDRYEFYEDVLYYHVLSATKIDENLAGGIESDRPIYVKQDEGVYEYCGTWDEINGAVMTALAQEEEREEEEKPKPDEKGDGDHSGVPDGSGGNTDGDTGSDDNPGNGDSAGGDTGSDDNPGNGDSAGGDTGSDDNPGNGDSAGGDTGSDDNPGNGDSAGGDTGSDDNPDHGDSAGDNTGSGNDDSGSDGGIADSPGGDHSGSSGNMGGDSGKSAGDDAADQKASAAAASRQDGWIKLVAADEPAQDDSAGMDDHTEPTGPENPEKTADSEEPDKPVNPTEPGNPVEPEEPAEPESPVGPEGPENPAEPEGPGNPAEPVEPEGPGNPAEPVEPTEPENPVEPDDSEENEGESVSDTFALQENSEYYLVAFGKVDDITESAQNTPMYSVGNIDNIVQSENGEYEFVEWDRTDISQGRQEYTFAGKEIWCKNTFRSNEWFKKYVLNMDPQEYGNFRIKVLTFTPRELEEMERIPNFHFLYLNSGVKDRETISGNGTVSGNDDGDAENSGGGSAAYVDSIRSGLFAADSLPGRWRKLVADGNGEERTGGFSAGSVSDNDGGSGESGSPEEEAGSGQDDGSGNGSGFVENGDSGDHGGFVEGGVPTEGDGSVESSVSENDGGSVEDDGWEDAGGFVEDSVSGNDAASVTTGVSENNSGTYRKPKAVSGSVSDNDIGESKALSYAADNDLSAGLLTYFLEKTIAGAVPCLIDGSILYGKDESGSISVSEKLESTYIFRLSAMLCQDNLSEWYETHRNDYGTLTAKQLIDGIVKDADKNFVEEHVYCRFGNGADSIINDMFFEATIYKDGGEIEPGFQCVLDEIKLENLYRESDSSGNYKPLSTEISQAKAVRHILNYADRRKVKTKTEIRVLEIQPAMADEPELTLDQIRTWAPDVKKADITVMTTAEFIGKIEKLNETYDLIYIGTSKDHLNMRYWTDSTYTGKPDKHHAAAGTVFNDSEMDGLIYYNIGDKRVMTLPMAGLLDSEYPKGDRSDWTYFYNYTRYGGNDISREKMNALLSFMDGSYPIIVADDFLEQPATVFADREYRGARVNLAEGAYTEKQLTALGVKKQDISSVKVKDGYRLTVFDEDEYAGSSETFTEDVSDLAKKARGKGNWDNKTLSLIVEREKDAAPDRKLDGDHIDNCTYLYEFVEKAMEEKYLNFYAWSDIAENSELFKFYLNRPKVSLEDQAANGEVKEGSNIYYIESDINGKYELQYKFRIQNEGTASYGTRYRCKLYIDVNSDGKFSGSEEIEDIVLTQGGNRVSPEDLYADREYRLSRVVPTGYKGLLPWRVEITQADNPNIYTSMSGYTKLKGMEKEVLKICQINKNGSGQIWLDKETREKDDYFNILIYGGDYDGVHYPGITDEFELDITSIDINRFHREYHANNDYLKDFNMLILGFSDMYGDFEGDAENGPMGAIVDFINSGKSVLLGHDTTSFFNSPGTGNEMQGYPRRDQLKTLRGQAGYEQRFAATLNKYVRPIVGMDRYGILQIDVLRRGDVLKKGTDDYDAVVDSGKNVAYKPRSGRKETVPEVHGYTYALISAKDQRHSEANVKENQYTKWNMMTDGYKDAPEIVFENKYTNIRYDPPYFGNNHKEDDGELRAGNVANGAVNNVHAVQVNQGQITEYPYRLKPEFEVAQTHMQYYQLDYTADDDGDGQSDLVVWYCLGGRSSDISEEQRTTIYSQSPNDVCNNYYIYNKGNITYTGMGHSGGKETKYTFEEAKLFINTMIASYQAGIRDPQIRVLKSGVPEAEEMKLLYRYYDKSNQFSLAEQVTEAEGYEKIYFTVQDMNFIKGTREIASKVYYKDDGGTEEIEVGEETLADGQKVKKKVRVNQVGGSICSAKDNSVVNPENLTSGGIYYIQVPRSVMEKCKDGLELYFEAQTTLTTNTVKENVYVTGKVYAKLQVLEAYLFDLE